MHDYEEYKNNLRDFYIDIEELPGPVVKTQDKMMEAIVEQLNDFNVDEKYLQFNRKYNYLDGGDTSKKALEQIIY